MHLIGSLRSEGYSLGRIPGLIPLSRHDNESRVPSSPFLMGTGVTSCTKFNDPAPLLFSREREDGSVRVGENFWLFSTSKSLLSRPRRVASGTPASVWLASNALFSRASLTSRENGNRYTNRFNFRCCGDIGKICVYRNQPIANFVRLKRC